MEKRLMETIRTRMCKEAEDVVSKKSLSPVDVDAMYKITGTLKNLDKIEERHGGGHSRDGMWRANMEGEYSRGNSYDNGGYSQRRYSRDGDYSQDGGYSMNYSRDGGGIPNQLRRMMNETNDPKEQEMLKRFIHEAERR